MSHGPETEFTSALAIALSTAAYCSLGVADAEAIRFNNDGSFVPFYSLGEFGALDLTKPVSQQNIDIYSTDGSDVGFRYDEPIDAVNLWNSGAETAESDEVTLGGFARAFSKDEIISSGANFDGTNQLRTTSEGEFVDDGSRQYIGVRLNLEGLAHYGWIAVSTPGNLGSLRVHAWGYETEPDTAIAAGVPTPSTLAGLALGAVAFTGRKRR